MTVISIKYNLIEVDYNFKFGSPVSLARSCSGLLFKNEINEDYLIKDEELTKKKYRKEKLKRIICTT
jgi:hypothetical protein